MFLVLTVALTSDSWWHPVLGGQITLFAEVTADPCPTIQWMVNSSAVSGGGNYMIGNPCFSSPAGTTVFNFTLTITATAVTTGMYSATLTNRNGSTNVQEVFVTPPGMLTVRRYSQSSRLYDRYFFGLCSSSCYH